MRQRILRREFLTRSATRSAIVTFGASVPLALCRAAVSSNDQQRILVVVEMAGGNDGLNCVVPHSHDVYLKSRKELRINQSDTLAINAEIGLHPSLRGFADLLESNQFAVVQGVGYPNPNRSHFESMDIWHSCFRKDQVRLDGWLGRYLNTARLAKNSDPAAIHLGRDKQPFALSSREGQAVSIRSLDQFRLAKDESEAIRTAIRELAEQESSGAVQNDLLSFVRDSTSAAITASDQVEAAVDHGPSSLANYPQTPLGKQLETVSKLIASKMQTSIYYVRLDGFDTHANQPDAHAALLRDVSESVTALVNDLGQRGQADRTLVMCFSEFGRRVAENASDGTDHGTAGPVFLASPKINSGLIGEMPSLTDLDQGDLKFHTDFRQIYATILSQWLACDPTAVLGQTFKQLKLF